MVSRVFIILKKGLSTPILLLCQAQLYASMFIYKAHDLCKSSLLQSTLQIFEGSVRGLRPVEGPQPVKFPLPDPRNPLSLKPGSLTSHATLILQSTRPNSKLDL